MPFPSDTGVRKSKTKVLMIISVSLFACLSALLHFSYGKGDVSKSVLCYPKCPQSGLGFFAYLILILIDFGLGKRAVRGAIKVLKRSARLQWRLVPER